MKFELTVLGTNGAVPTARRGASANLLRLEAEDFLIDCGEGTQIQLLRAGASIARVEHIFVSHLHGDHYFGLPGLITSQSLLRRTRPLTIYSPPGLRDRLAPLLELDRYSPPYPLTFREFAATELSPVIETKTAEVFAFPLRHRITCNGYLIRERQRPANIISARIGELGIPYQQIPAIKAGADFTTADGRVVANAELTVPAAAPRSYAYCSDTIYFPELAGYIRGVDLLYHEATFTHDRAEEARKKGHSTALEAAWTGADAGAKMLVMGHFSSSYDRVDGFEAEARTLLAESYAADDLTRYVVPYVGRG